MNEINGVTVLGANGTMGSNISAIFAAFGGAHVYMISRTKEKSEKAIEKAVRSVRADSIKERLIPADYGGLEECIGNSDLIFEACAEEWDVKESVHRMTADIIGDSTEKIICSGTSGLSITKIAECYGGNCRRNVMGMHMFNPPYTMSLCEMIPSAYTDRAVFEDVKTYCSRTLYRTVVEVRDSPAFLGNRIGFQFINQALRLAEKYRYNGGVDYIDAIFGPFTGRAMPPLATSDFVGLDVHKAIVDNICINTSDALNETFQMPAFAEKLIEEGNLGKKVGCGLYKTVMHESGAKIRRVYDIESGVYRDVMKYTFPFAEQMVSYLKDGNYESAFAVLKNNRSVEAELCCSSLLTYVLYALAVSAEIAGSAHSADDVMAAGFNWCPPLAMIKALGGSAEFESLCRERLDGTLLNNIGFDGLAGKIEKSSYDYRRYIRAKR